MTTSNRRVFFRCGPAAAAMANRLVYGAAASQKIKLGLIGCGWYGMVDVNAALKAGEIEIVALSDADSAHLKDAASEIEKKQGTRPVEFKDYRELLNTPGLQAVIIATPPHWHALPFIAACKKGLDIYEEKPLAYDIREGRAMVEAARQSGKVIQIGFQRRQSDAFQQAAQYIREGKAGKIVQVECANSLLRRHTRTLRPKRRPQRSIGNSGAAPRRSYRTAPAIGHKSWRLAEPYGNGHLVDWGIHLIDATRMILGESTPKFVEAVGGLYHLQGKITTPDNAHRALRV